jgi:hypothetical protein
VPDGDFLRSDEDVLDEQPQDTLAFFDGGGGGVPAQLGQEAFQVTGEFEVGVAVGGLGVERIELAAHAGLAGAQVRHLGAQFVDGDQLLGVDKVISEEETTGYLHRPAWDVLQRELTTAGFVQAEGTEGLLAWRLASRVTTNRDDQTAAAPSL